MTDLVRVPKILGSDVELGNFIDGAQSQSGTGQAASRLLLREMPGIAARTSAGAASWGAGNAQDRGRRFLPGNGGCAYIDLDHLEVATAETRSAYDHLAHFRAMLHLTRGAVHGVNARMPEGYRVRALANCSDGHGHSYGAHLNVLLTRAAWDDIVRRKPHHLASLVAFQVSSIVFTGAGKVGSENGRPWADYQLSQRADFLETVLGEQTTYDRPIVNARDEAWCGGSWSNHAGDAGVPDLARLHVIFFDATLCQVATLLRAGTMQIVTAMFEAGRVPAHLALDDPLEALQRWSHDPSLRARARLVSGEAVTAADLQRRFLAEARACGATLGFEGVVPRADEILAMWADTLQKLHERDFDWLGRRLDWVLKQQILRRAMASRPSLSWSSPELRHLDQIYASLDETEGLFWAYEQSGLVEAVVHQNDITHAVDEPPEDTRAWARAQLLRHAGAARVESVDWDVVQVRLPTDGRGYARTEGIRVQLPCPYQSTRREHEAVFAPGRSLDEIVAALAPEGAIQASACLPASRPAERGKATLPS